MIRVNLLRSIGVAKGPTTGVATDPGLDTDMSFVKTEGGLKAKGILFIAPIILVIVFIQYNYLEKKSKRDRLQKELKVVQAELKRLEPDVREVERYKEEKRKLEAQLEVVKSLSKERLRNVKSLDALQSLIPQKAWLDSLVIKDSRVILAGFAVDDIVVSEFLQNLESSIFFSNVTLVASEDQKTKAGVVKKFSIRTQLENM